MAGLVQTQGFKLNVGEMNLAVGTQAPKPHVRHPALPLRAERVAEDLAFLNMRLC